MPRRHSHSWTAQASQSVRPATSAARHEHISQNSSAITRNHARLQTGQSYAATGSGRSAGGNADLARDAARSAASPTRRRNRCAVAVVVPAARGRLRGFGGSSSRSSRP